jgi:beta-lactamase regulating signal transducer with metallopeptidase domain
MTAAALLLLLAKATVVLVAALGLTRLLHRAPAGARHLVWLATLGALLLVPALAAWGPLHIPAWPAATPAALAAADAPATAGPVATDPAPPEPAAAAAGPVALVSPDGHVLLASPPATAARATGSPAATSAATRPADGPGRDRLGALRDALALDHLPVRAAGAALALWAAVALAIAGALAHAWLAVRRIVRHARPLDTADWRDPLYEVADRLGLDEAPRLLRSAHARMPFACGLRQPTVVLPADCDGWSADRRRAVLLHELAHVRRRDLVGHTLARLVCAVYWFHPMVWSAAKRLRAESERACDDLALASGARASDYAEHLLEIVTSVRVDATPAMALAMARRAEFEGRMLAILDPERPRVATSRRQTLTVVGVLAVVTVVVGAAAPADAASARRVGDAAARPAADLAGVAPAAADARPDRPTASRSAPDTTLPARLAVPPSAAPPVDARGDADAPAVAVTVDGVSSAVAAAVAAAGVTGRTEAHGALSPTFEATVVRATARATARATGAAPATPDAARGADERATLLARVLRTDTSAALRRIAAWGLADHADRPEAAAALAAALRGDANAAVREMSAWALGDADGSMAARTALAAALRSDADAHVRATAAWALGSVGDDGAAGDLAAALDDASPEVRQRAAWAIGQVEPARAPRQLVALLGDRDPRLRKLAAWSLYAIADPAAAPALQGALRTERDSTLQVAYIRALAALGDDAVDALRALLDAPDPRLRAVAVRALAGGRAGDPWPWPWPQPRPFP